MALLRASAARLAAWTPFESAVEQMTEQMVFRQMRRPSPAEQRSWARSIPTLARDLVDAGLSDSEVLLEQQLPLNSGRIDAIVAGYHPKTGRPSYVVIELKQWSEAQTYEGNPELVMINGYGSQPVLHPSAQVQRYCQYLLDFTPMLGEQEAHLTGVAYLHNATDHSVMTLRDYPPSPTAQMVTGDRRAELVEILRTTIDPNVPGMTAADLLLNASEAPSRQLLTVAAAEIQDREQFVLLDEQRVAYNIVLHAVEKSRSSDTKQVVIVSGGPGTGKSVIALSLLGELARQGRTVLHATGSRSFTQTLRKIAGHRSTRTKALFKYFNSFMEAEKNGLDVLILDEAHRIRETSADRWTRASERTGRPQVEELISAARVPVFLLDEHQTVKPGELGSIEEITTYAASVGLPVHLIQLDDQFRCGGSEAYVGWVLRLLGLVPGGPIPWPGDDHFSLRMAESPQELEAAMRTEKDRGYTARITAGYCWPWSKPLPDGTLVEDVTIGSWSKPWNLRDERAVGGAPPSALWATDPAGFGQVGCVYTAQGFEYDWNGVIFGPDLVWRRDRWVAQRSGSKDPNFRSVNTVPNDEFDRLIRNVYKVLLTRGMVGTVIYSTDQETQAMLRALIH